MEIPNARFMEEASLRLNFSSSYPYEYTSLTATPFSWMEATYRYTELKNILYGPAIYSGNQSLKDKGFDLKFRLIREGAYIPSIALGLRDLAGTGLFSSEYIVATKNISNFDLSLGMGWGGLGMANNISNPFVSFHESFKIREDAGKVEAGLFNPKEWFSGKTALIGGIEYDLKKYGLRLKLEYDTTNQDEVTSDISVRSRLNFGASYFLSDSFNVSAAFERGDQFRVSFNLKGNFLRDTIKKPKPKNVLKLNRKQLERYKEDSNIFYRSLNRSLRDESIYIQAADLKENEVDIAVASSRFYSFTRLAGRTARIVSALSPDEVEKINIHSMNGDFEIAVISVDRKEFDDSDKGFGSSNELLRKTKLSSDSDNPIYKSADFQPTINFPEFDWTMSPGLKHQIGGPEAFYLGQLYWRTDTTLKITRGLSLYTTLGFDIYNNFNQFNNPSYSTIPHVRSDIQDYLKEGKNNIARMQLEYMYSPKKDWFMRFDIGYLEEMFGGFGGEVLYRPFNKSIEYGLSVHRVKQRDYDQRFSFRDYETTTGHISLYYDFSDKVAGTLQAGKYLAGDKGVTIDLSRRFETGFTLGVFATKTDLSAIEFGEGSFDKGFYFSIPTKLFYTDYRRGNITFGLHPLTKDGGAILMHHHPLHSLLGDSNRETFSRDWRDFLN